VGRNGAGKSSILEAIYFASAAAEPLDPLIGMPKLERIAMRRGSRRSQPEDLWHMTNIRENIEIKIEGSGRHILVKLAHPSSIFVEIPACSVTFICGGLSDSQCSFIGNFSSKSEREEAFNELAEARNRFYGLLRAVILVDDIILRSPSAIERYAWPRVLSKRLERKIVELLKSEFEPDAEYITYVPVATAASGTSAVQEYRLALVTSKTAILIDGLADGARWATLMALLVLASQPTMLLIEEPETHLHPGWIIAVMRFLIELARDLGFQMIASTHSMDVIRITGYVARELGVRSSLIFTERENGKLITRQFSLDEEVEVLRELGIDPRLLYKF
jgi:hypothetical protein